MPSEGQEGAPTPIVQYWDSEGIPDYVAVLLASFDDLNPGAEHLVFSESQAVDFLAGRFSQRHLDAFRACGVPAMQADYFRYCAVYELGGVYVDADFRCLGPLHPLLSVDAGDGILFGRPELPPPWRTPAFEGRERVGPYRVVMNSIFAFPSPRHPLLGLAIEIATANIEHRIADDVALVTGPAIFTSLYLLRELGSFDAFAEYAEGGALQRSARLLCETIGDHSRVEGAFEGVRLLPVEETGKWVGNPDAPLPYKAGEDHWMNVKTGIYR